MAAVAISTQPIPPKQAATPDGRLLGFPAIIFYVGPTTTGQPERGRQCADKEDARDGDAVWRGDAPSNDSDGDDQDQHKPPPQAIPGRWSTGVGLKGKQETT